MVALESSLSCTLKDVKCTNGMFAIKSINSTVMTQNITLEGKCPCALSLRLLAFMRIRPFSIKQHRDTFGQLSMVIQRDDY
jgi:hypothetical protein